MRLEWSQSDQRTEEEDLTKCWTVPLKPLAVGFECCCRGNNPGYRDLFDIYLCFLPVSASRAPPSAAVGVPAGDHRHAASQLLRLVVSGSAGGAGGRGLPGEVRRRAAPHCGQRSLWRPAAVGVGQDARRDGEGQRGGTRRGRRGVFGGGRADESQVLQPTGHGGVSQGGSYLLTRVSQETRETTQSENLRDGTGNEDRDRK